MAREDQYMNPQGEEGREVLKSMNEHHRDLTIWGLSNIPPMHATRILDIGCGGGNTIKMLSVKYPNASIDGIDISEEAVKATLETNSVFHKWGKVNASVASVENIPFPENTFDIITAVETYFFWPDLEKNISHATSRLKKGGVLCVVSEQYFTDKNRTDLEASCKKYHMNIVENDVLKGYLEQCGLKTQISLVEEKNWVVFIGIKE